MTRTRTILLTLCLLLPGGACIARQPPAGPIKEPDQTDIAYGPAPHQDLDLYLPTTKGPHPLIVFAHGGGWEHGNKQPGRFLAPALGQAGYVLASVNYRFVPDVSVAQSVGDVASATAFLLKNAAQYGIDPRGFAVAGHSSGGHIAGLLGTDATYLRGAGLDPNRLRAVITLDGVFDVTANLTEYPTDKRLGVFGHDPAVWRAFSPTEKAATMTNHPRFCVAHEDTNKRMLEQSTLFIAALQKSGQTVETVVAPGLTHPEMAKLFSDPAQPIGTFVVACLGRAFQAR